jgi:guanylate kinase
MIVIVGESASGKSTIVKELNKLGYNNIVTYTTRPPRNNEVNGIDYYFVTDFEYFNLKDSNFFAETGDYRGWHYGTPVKDCTDDKVNVVTPSGLRQLKKYSYLNIISFYIKVPRRDRLIKLLQRDSDIEESYRRSVSDLGQFDGIEDEVDYIIDNAGYKNTPEVLAGIINTFYEKEIENREESWT